MVVQYIPLLNRYVLSTIDALYDYIVAFLQGDLWPDDAADMLTIFEGKFTYLKDDRDNLIKAKEALKLADSGECMVAFVLSMIIY